jgi:hypothetical protein
LQHLQILLVDDDPDTRDFLEVALAAHGATVTTVASAQEALGVFAHHSFDVLISDIGMPDMDGYALIRAIRDQAAASGGRIPAIALTAYAGDKNQQKAIAAGFQYHVSKPVEVDKLPPIIIDLVQNQSLDR